jgi:hypothetical protein
VGIFFGELSGCPGGEEQEPSHTGSIFLPYFVRILFSLYSALRTLEHSGEYKTLLQLRC